MPYAYDLGFQEYILASALADPEFLKGNVDVYNPDYFNDDILRGICDITLDFFKKNREVPSRDAILQELKTIIAPGRHLSEYEEVLEHIFEKVGYNTLYYQGRAIDFARSQAVGNAIKESVIHLQSGELSEVGRLVNEALRVGDGLVNSNLYDYLNGAKERATDYQNAKTVDPLRVATGFYLLDEVMNGGLGVGELGIVVSLPKSGKTTTLINLAFAALMQNKSVNYFTLELSKRLVASKFDVRIFGQELATIKRKPKSFFEALEKIKKTITGKLNIIEYPTKSMTVSKMEGVLNKHRADLNFVDYGQLIKPIGGKAERRHQLTEVYEDLRRVAGESGTRIWTAHQANRPGFGTKTIHSNDVAEDFNIVGVADFLMSFNQTEEEKRIGRGRFYVMGSRIGDSGNTVNLDVNFKISSIAISQEEQEDLG